MLEKRENENITQLAIRSIRYEFLSDIQSRLSGIEPDVSALGEEHVVGYKAGYVKAVNEARLILAEAMNE